MNLKLQMLQKPFEHLTLVRKSLNQKKTFETLNVVKTFQTLKLQGKRQVKTKNFSQS
jgi:hypothetical protein